MKILGECFGVEILPPPEKGASDMVQLLVEDDENWHKKGEPFSAYWLNDIIGVLREAQAHLRLKNGK